MKEHKTINRNAFDEIYKRFDIDETDDVENAICLLWNETDWMEDNAYLAATHYAAMQARIDRLEALQVIAEDVNTWLIKNKLGGTAHQRSLAEALYALKGEE